MSRSLGVIIYHDGSQAEIIEHDDSALTWTEIVRLRRPRKLTMVFE